MLNFPWFGSALRDRSAQASFEVEDSQARQRERLDATHHAILAQLAEGVIVTDTTGRITLVNEAAAHIHGVACLNVKPDGYSSTYHLFTEDGQPYAPLDLPLARAVRGETVEDARWRVRRPDNTEIVAIGTAKPLYGRDGRQIGAVLTLRDDTARVGAERSLRESETALRALNDTLSERVTERTRDAEAAQLAAERASAAKTEFLAAMSHEIRTPLNAIIGFTDAMVGSNRLPADLQRQATIVRTAGSALLTIVNDILDFSKAEAGAIELEHEPFRSKALIDNCLSIVKSSAVEKALDLRSQIDPNLPRGLIGDAARLQQILLNLLNNAIKFTSSGSVDLTVRYDDATPAEPKLRFSITDTGIGVPTDKQSRLFQRFSQVDGSIQRNFGGTGLGLAICKQLVELMGGEIGVISDEGLGSTFWFSVTLPSAVLEDEIAPAHVAAKSRTPSYLLLVEDVVINQELARIVLEAAGHRVDVVSDGAAAIVAVAENTYDLVLMDVQMPGMDGLTATRRIRDLPSALARIPIVAMTANVLPEQVRACREAGMDDYVGKPFNKTALYATLDRWLSPRSDNIDSEQPDSVLDHAIFDEVAALLPSDKMTNMLCLLVQQMKETFAEPSLHSSDRDRLRVEAHALCSAAGMIGLTKLSAECSALEARTEERIARDGVEDFSRVLTRLRSHTTAAAAQLGTLLDERLSSATVTGVRIAG